VCPREVWLHVQSVSYDDGRLDPVQDRDLSERSCNLCKMKVRLPLFIGDCVKRFCRMLCCYRIMKPVDGTAVYRDAEAREHCRQSWQQILKIMEIIGYKPDVRLPMMWSPFILVNFFVYCCRL